MSVQAPADPSALLARLSAQVSRHVGREPRDDVALLLIERTTREPADVAGEGGQLPSPPLSGNSHTKPCEGLMLLTG